MAEAFVIILCLGSLEVLLWFISQRNEKRQYDAEIDALNSIAAELAEINDKTEPEEEPKQ
jgi:signal transduction protein with GAF and PtsI domain